MTLPTPEEEAKEELLHHNHIQNSIENYGETLVIRTRKAVAKELREIMSVALNTPYCHKTEQELRDCLGVLVAKCDALAQQLDGEKVTR